MFGIWGKKKMEKKIVKYRQGELEPGKTPWGLVLRTPVPIVGAKIAGDDRKVSVDFSTSFDCVAIGWLTKTALDHGLKLDGPVIFDPGKNVRIELSVPANSFVDTKTAVLNITFFSNDYEFVRE